MPCRPSVSDSAAKSPTVVAVEGIVRHTVDFALHGEDEDEEEENGAIDHPHTPARVRRFLSPHSKAEAVFRRDVQWPAGIRLASLRISPGFWPKVLPHCETAGRVFFFTILQF